MSGAINCVRAAWSYPCLPEAFVSKGVLKELEQGQGFEGALSRLVGVLYAAALDPDPSKYGATRIDQGTAALTLFGVELAICGGGGAPIVVLLLAEWPVWHEHGCEVGQEVFTDVAALPALSRPH